MAQRIAQFTLDGPAGRFDRPAGIVRFEPAARRQFTATDDLKAQIARLKAQVAESLARAERAEAALARIKLAAPAISPATTPADAFAAMAGRIYSERRQMSAPEATPEPFGMSAEAVYAARRKAAQRLL